MDTQIDLAAISGLTAERWQAAKQHAIDATRGSAGEPRPEHYISQRGISAYPAWFTRGLIGVLIIVAGAAFWMSAGKQVMAAGMLVDPLPKQTSRLSPLWGDMAIALSLAFGELGAVLFQVAAAVFEGKSKRLIFRAFAIACAALAVIANISITATHLIPDISIFQWAMTILPPVTVLGIGMLIESLVISALKARAEQRAAYQAALEDWQRLQAAPEMHPDFKSTWAKSIYDELCRHKKDRDLIVELPNELKFELVNREYRAHMLWEGFDPAKIAGKRAVSAGKPGNSLSGNERKAVEITGKSLSNGLSKHDRIVAHLAENPGDIALSNRELAAKVGDVSHVLAGQAKQTYVTQNTDQEAVS